MDRDAGLTDIVALELKRLARFIIEHRPVLQCSDWFMYMSRTEPAHRHQLFHPVLHFLAALLLLQLNSPCLDNDCSQTLTSQLR